MAETSRIEAELEAIISGEPCKVEPDGTSSIENILWSIINSAPYDDPPVCRIDVLLLKLKELIEHGMSVSRVGGALAVYSGISANGRVGETDTIS